MSDIVFLVPDEGDPRPMRMMPYDTEDVLQALLARTPDVLSAVTSADEAPRRWLLVRREQGIPGEEGGGNLFWLDHLFLDQDGVPTLVEVKRFSDTRIRREVVGQMLDYAANGVVYWPIETLRASFERTIDDSGPTADPDVWLQERLQIDDVEEYWKRVQANLQSGRVRMVFLADRIPDSLRRIIEFLNGQMSPATVVGIEVKQFVGDGLRTLIPEAVGVTSLARSVKNTRPRQVAPSIEEWVDQFERLGPDWRDRATRFVAFLRELSGAVSPSNAGKSLLVEVEDADGKLRYPIGGDRLGNMWLGWRWMRHAEAFASEDSRQEIVDRIRAIPGVTMHNDNINGQPSWSMRAIDDPETLSALRPILQAIVDKTAATRAARVET